MNYIIKSLKNTLRILKYKIKIKIKINRLSNKHWYSDHYSKSRILNLLTKIFINRIKHKLNGPQIIILKIF